jgi:hypothetical protein
MNIEQRFEELASKWRKETELYSSIARICEHPAYQEIIQMGEPVIPFILRDLQKELNHWFWALVQITKANPVSEHTSSIKEMADDWIQWGKDKGYI